MATANDSNQQPGHYDNHGDWRPGDSTQQPDPMAVVGQALAQFHEERSDASWQVATAAILYAQAAELRSIRNLLTKLYALQLAQETQEADDDDA